MEVGSPGGLLEALGRGSGERVHFSDFELSEDEDDDGAANEPGPRYRRRLPRPTSPSGARRLPPGPSVGEPVAALDTATAEQAGGLRASWPLLAALTLSRRGGRQ